MNRPSFSPIITTLVSMAGMAGRWRADREPDIQEPGTMLHSINVEGLMRYYLFHPPCGVKPEPKLPLVIFLQGGGSYPAQNYEKWTGFDAIADREGFIVVYACAAAGAEKPEWSGQMNGSKEDLIFMDNLIEELIATQPVDPQRIYLSGLSAGANLSHRVAVEMGDRFAAVGVVAGTFWWKTDVTPAPVIHVPPPAAPVQILIIHGVKDDRVAYEGFKTERKFGWPVVKAVDYWVHADGCDPVPTVTTSDNGEIVTTTYTGGKDGTVVRLDTRVNGGHEWPASPDYPASQVLWDFFKQFSLKERPVKK